MFIFKVANYGQIARLAGKPKASRAVGQLMKNKVNLTLCLWKR
jgi:alkylated DNA nucleotide flippase Atl1